MQDKRPDPDRILHQIQQQEADAAHVRGRLKIFFGYAAGVGKTYAMLEAAHAALAAGTDVVAGYIEPHTRPDTLALLEGLEQLPPLCVEYKNVTLRCPSSCGRACPYQRGGLPAPKALPGYRRIAGAWH